MNHPDPEFPEQLTRSEKTKYRLAQSMKECMKTTSVDSITVRQITEHCHLTRQTFYRNFLDKYDLINWYFDKLLLKSFEHMGRGKTISEGLEKKFTYIAKEQLFFAAAFRYDSQNSLREHDFQLIFQFYQDLIREKTGQNPTEEMQFLLEMYCQGSIAMTVKWVLCGMEQSPAELSDLLIQAMPAKLSLLFEQHDILD
ncbi:MAG: TetR/AcrR family transcriptional regulator C-terminal domain-containing protein [Fusicatenibacter sp.]|nr:TetR family transcriptional regulator C-terminal domain-containing protein [Fusicatenibacter sp.]